MKKIKRNKITEEEYKKFFIEQYEKTIMNLREEYYKKKQKQLNKQDTLEEIEDIDIEEDNDALLFILKPKTIFISITSILGIALLLAFDFSFLSLFIVLASLLLTSFLFSYFNRHKSHTEYDRYLIEIQKLGYLTIDDYEEDLEKYITNEDAYYSNLFKQLVADLNLNENVSTVYSIYEEPYYVWLDNRECINFLNTNITKKPVIETYPLNRVKYYRVDYEKKTLIFKTDLDEHYFTETSILVFSSLLPKKKYGSEVITIEEAIYDYESFMIHVKEKYQVQEETRYFEQKEATAHRSIYVIMLLLTAIVNIFPFHFWLVSILFFIYSAISLFELNKGFYANFEYKFAVRYKDEELIKILNEDEDCIAKFEELKFMLHISNTYPTIHTKQGDSYYIWKQQENIHLFLNIIYFNCIYLIVPIKDIKGYQITEDSTQLLLQDKTLEFKKEDYTLLNQILEEKK